MGQPRDRAFGGGAARRGALDRSRQAGPQGVCRPLRPLLRSDLLVLLLPLRPARGGGGPGERDVPASAGRPREFRMARNPILSMALQSRVQLDVEAAAPTALDRAPGPDRGERRERSRATLAAPGAGPRAAQGRPQADPPPTLSRALRIRSAPVSPGWLRLEAEMNRRIGNLDPRWTPVVGGAALVLLGVVGFAFWRQRGSVKPAIASLR